MAGSGEGGAWFDLPESLDSIVLDRVPVSALLDIWRLEGVVVVEMQNVLVPTNDVASRPSEHATATSTPARFTPPD